MLEDLRVSAFSEVAWNTKCDTQYKEEAIDAVHLIECERYEGINEVRDGINYSSVKHAPQPRDQAATNGGVESQLDDWLQRTVSGILEDRLLMRNLVLTVTRAHTSPYDLLRPGNVLEVFESCFAIVQT